MDSTIKEIPSLKVGEVAKFVPCSIGTINNYIKQGFIKEPLRDKNGHRRFTKSQAVRLREIFNIRIAV
jgi:DNA-binding transcriptional MerR regulator